MYTELLNYKADDAYPRLKSLVKGDFDTMSLLLGIVNVESWTNVAVEVEVDENVLGGHELQHRRRLA